MKLERVHRVISSRLGELPLQEGGSTFKPAGKKRETKSGEVPENTGYTEKQTFAELKLKLNATGAIGVEEMSDMDEDTLTIFTTGGKQYMMPNAWVTEPGELGDAEMSVTYNCGTSPRL
ncbi:hypothetical protein AGMMS49942_13230 [Spirochaetia bacterium]|nr:hypothetical protein AGMMS49942_13230 [Spirochaetia bacterium]